MRGPRECPRLHGVVRVRVGFTANQFQELLVAELLRIGVEQLAHLPIFMMPNQMNKEVRIRRLGTYLAQRKLHYKKRSPGTALLVQQMQDFPVGDHDDGPDACPVDPNRSLEWEIRFCTESRPAHPVKPA